jgi:lipid-A-disaccharide synthase
MDELSVMGLAEVLPKYRALKRRIAQTGAQVLADRPDALITIDSPDFCLRVAAIVKAARPDLRTIHYVAPSVWAWRPGRAEKMARVIDHVLALLPMEPPLMQAAGMTCDFVGHPVVAEPQMDHTAARGFFASEGPLILTLPGSRKGEVTRLAPVFGQVLAGVRHQHPQAQVLLPTVPNVEHLVRTLTQDWPIRPLILTDATQKGAAFAAADVALAASGTVSLELAANACPMVIAYKMNWLTHWIMQRAALIDTVTLVNIITQTRTIPEFLGPDCQPDSIGAALEAILQQGPRRTAQIAAMAQAMQALGQGGTDPALRAARAIMAQL